MSARSLAIRPTQVSGLRSAAVFLLVAAGSYEIGFWAQDPARARLAAAGVALLCVAVFFLNSSRHLLFATLVWLSVLGLVRRLLDEVSPRPGLDPVLLVSPLALGLLVLFAWRSANAYGAPNGLTKAVLTFSALVLIGAVNPLQGSVFGGLAGLLFVLVPTFGFWIGRAICDDRTLARVLHILVVLSVGIAVYGLAQTLIGFPGWDRSWINSSSVVSLNVNGAIRPFGTLNAASEYGTFLAVGLVALVAQMRVVTAAVALPAIALLGTAVFLESSRGLVIAVVAAAGVILGVRARLNGFVTVAIAALLLVGLGYGVKHIGVSDSGTSTSGLVSHQLTGLSNPLDPNTSTAAGHLSRLVDGLRTAVHNPVGDGIGAITIAGHRLGGLAAGTELDPSNVAVALGIPGLVLYVFIVVAGLRRLYARACDSRNPAVATAALAIAVVTLFEWLNGEDYATVLLPWLMLGWADRSSPGLSATRSSEPRATPST